ncbi:MAG: alanyl-tRNA editing protein [Bacillota bacterium]|nr:alanyl-tRNA editing protein [Bacillota bacterium]
MELTEKLYQKDVFLQACESRVLAAADGCLVLDRTVFFPEGGGQSCDTGTIENGKVLHVFEKDGVVFHQMEDGAGLPEEGAAVHCRIHWERRFLNMQRHCGEHILSAAFYELYGGVNRGFHMGADYMTVDISLEEDPAFEKMTDEMVAAAELRTNELIWQDLPVITEFFADGEEAAAHPMRKKLSIEKDITIVSLGSPDWAPGAVACCGTHPRTTGQVGLVKIYRWENYKGMARIYFDAGSQAFLHFRAEEELTRSLCKRYSAEPHQLMEKISIQDAKNQEIRQQLYELKKEYLAERAEEMAAACETEPGTLVRHYPHLKPDDLLALGKLLQGESLRDRVFSPPAAGKAGRLAALVAPAEKTVILLSGGAPDCGKIIKDNAPVWNGKGGGRPDSARALFSSDQDLACFLDFLQKAY